MTITMTREDVIQQLSFWKELWESKKAECDKYENRKYAWEKKYMLNCNIEVCKISLEALKQPERIKAKWKIDRDSGIATCTNCNHDYDDADNGYLLGEEMRYCPFCGAEMEAKQWEI